MTHRSALPPIQEGAVVALNDQDYRFGVGPLKLHVTAIPEYHETLGGQWMCMRGMEIDWRGVEIQARQVMVRIAAVEKCLREQHVAKVVR